MKRIIAIVLLCWSAGVMAEEKVWYCTEVAKAGLHFEDGKYKTTSFTTQRITIKQDGLEFKFSNHFPFLSGLCELWSPERPELITCSFLYWRFNINTKTGLASHSYDGGWVIKWERPDASSDVPMNVTALECETF